jgi:cation diffusion facilitator CzcD-associated flavoprotein CzcO
LVGIAEKWHLFQHIRFNNMVEEARWNKETNQWDTSVKVFGKDAEYAETYTISSNWLISAVGQLNNPQYPDLEGMDTFRGKMMHTARWDSSYDFDNKRVAVIGNGATAAQAIPELAKTAKSVTVFQRTPNWIIPRQDKPISKTMQSIYHHVPAVQRIYRAQLMREREAFFGFAVQGSSLNAYARQLCTEMMERQIPTNKKLRDALTPNYAPGCKRLILSDDYYVALNQPHVTLESAPIEEFTSEGISTGTTQHEFDLVVLATGFRTTEFMFPMKIYGAGGRAIDEVWGDGGGASAYLGMAVEQLPNFAMLYGPNTNLGHNSIILMIEAQSRYINTLIAPVLQARARGNSLIIQPKTQTITSYNSDLQVQLAKTTFADPRCTS